MLTQTLRHIAFVSLFLPFAAGCSLASADVEPDADSNPSTPPATEPPVETGSTEDDIVGGRLAHGRFRAVLALSLADDGLCTGSLIAPDLVLTARHCVSDTAESIDCPATGPQIGEDRDPASIVAWVGDDATNATPVALGLAIEAPPGDSLCGHDLAVIRLDRPVVGVTPLEVERRSKSLHGKTITAVGFGRKTDGGKAGKKRVRSGVRVLEATPREFVVGEVTCSGDSGGPAIDEQTGKIVGVLSRGGPTCKGPWSRNVYTRPSAFVGLLPLGAP